MVADEVVDRESETPLRSWHLRREAPDALGDAVALAAPGIEALFLVAAGLFEPLAVRTELVWLDRRDGSREGYPPLMEWLLVRRDRDHGAWPDPATLDEAAVIDREAVERFVAHAIAQPGAANQFACPTWIGFSTVRARLLEPHGNELRLGRKEGPATVPIERDGDAAWVTGPQSGFITPPVTARLRVDPNDLELAVDSHWSPWSEDDRPGTRAVEEAVARLVSSGWELEE